MNVPLTQQQKEIMQEFYSAPATRVVFRKTERNQLWSKATSRASDLDFDFIRKKCPALEHQIQKSYLTGRNIQSAVFSECAYAQTFANMMNLTLFVNCAQQTDFIPEPIMRLLSSYSLVPRYVYSSTDKQRMFIQAGGCEGIDSAFITGNDRKIYTVEFKEPGAKISEPDLPKYQEDGFLVVTENWLENYPQFKSMLDEQKGLNFFDSMGHNINHFTQESIRLAVTTCYTGTNKHADVICTEDSRGNLVMIPTDQAFAWAKIEGEIRPAGRNHYQVWTPMALKRFLSQKGASIQNDMVTIHKNLLEECRQRGGNRKLSGYKVTPSSLFISKTAWRTTGF